jgi:SanA protein
MKAKKVIKGIIVVALFILAFIIYSNVRISSYSKTRVYDDLSDIPHYHTALVLGTSPEGRFGGPNRFFIARINAAAELYESGKIDRILVSGDNRHKDYNEPAAMRVALIEKGIPEDIIFLDYAGFRTFDSVVRAKEVFGQSAFIVVSQKFHTERAVFIAGKKGIDAIGYNATDVSLRSGGIITHVREWGARCKVFLDLLFGKKPHFLGEPIDIG